MLPTLALSFIVLPLTISAEDGAKPRQKLDEESKRIVGRLLERSADYLRRTQNEDGSFGDGEFKTPITGIVVAGLLRTQRVTQSDPLVARGLAYLEKRVQADGGIEAAGGNRNYATAICLLAFTSANKDKKYQKTIDAAVNYLKNEQWDEGEGIDRKNPKYGGSGYGRKSRPDLSNTTFMLEALKSAGIGEKDPAFQRALVFIRRCQNLSGEEANDLPQGQLIGDGGFYYTAAEDYNPGGGDVQKGLRSYGSMTYAGLKSFIYAGLDRNDPRVQAALGWIKKNYTLKENPGVGDQGLFYYYHTFAKAMAVLGIDEFQDAQGEKHDWRAELIRSLAEKQNTDGSWSNLNKRWLESDPRLVTGYVLLALAEVMKSDDSK